MKSHDLEGYRARLNELREQLRNAIERTPAVICEESQPPGEHEHAPSEGIDAEIAWDNNERDVLRRVNDALARIDKRIFGRCRRCGREIAAARLSAVPYATHCIDCERQAERPR